MHERIAGGNVGSRECLGVIIVYSCSSAPMACARHTENINMHERDATRYRKPTTRLLVPTRVRAYVRVPSVRTRARKEYVRSGGITHAFTRSRLPLPSPLRYVPTPSPTGATQPPLNAPPTNEPLSDDANPTISSLPLRASLSLPVVSLPLFRTSLTCGEQHRLRRL